MALAIEENAAIILKSLAIQGTDEIGKAMLTGEELTKITDLLPNQINDAATILVESGLANLLYLAIGLGVWVVPVVPAVLKSHISVGALSIFVYLNWNVIRKLWKKKIE